jgi:diguanylate cyclase (GGDEF)-like protein
MISKNSILSKMTVLIIILCGLIVIYSASNLYSAWSDYRDVEDLELVEAMLAHFSEGLKHFMFERGRMNVILASQESISESNIDFIENRRELADLSFNSGFALLEDCYNEESNLLKEEYFKINSLRKEIDLEARKQYDEREDTVRNLWFSSCTDYINLVLERAAVISGHAQDNILIDHYIAFILDTIQFRGVIGIESSIFTSAITNKMMLTEEEYISFVGYRGRSNQLWSSMGRHISFIDSVNLNDSFSEVYQKYYEDFRIKQDEILALSKLNEVYEGACKEIAALSVPALDSVFIITNQALSEISFEINNITSLVYTRLIMSILLLLTSLTIAIMTPIFLWRYLVKPLNLIINKIDRLSNQENIDDSIYRNREDEIGKLASGVRLLSNTMRVEEELKQELRETVQKLEELSIKDYLTGLYNRRHVSAIIDKIEGSCIKDKGCLAVIIGDIDHFKMINDTYGHEIGDKVLVEVSNLLFGYCSEEDTLARWGGEEFLLLLPNKSLKEAFDIAEVMREVISTHEFNYNKELIKVTMTFGVSNNGDNIEDIIISADTALFKGKNSGRNIVVMVNKNDRFDYE